MAAAPLGSADGWPVSRPFPVISLSHHRRVPHEYVHWEWHPEKHLRMADALRRQNPLWFEPQISLTELSQFLGPPFDEDLALLRQEGDYSQQLAFHRLEKLPVGSLLA